MSFFRALFSSEVNDEPEAEQRNAVVSLPIYSLGLARFREGCEMVDGAHGAFGRTATNPIPVNGVRGETIYINRLRGKSGVGFMYHRTGSIGSPVVPNPVDRFELVAVDGSERHEIYFDPYFLRRSRKAPDGLQLVPWSSMDQQARVMCKINGFGTNGVVQDFPWTLPDVIKDSPELNSISPGMGKAIASRISGLLDQHKREFEKLYPHNLG